MQLYIKFEIDPGTVIQQKIEGRIQEEVLAVKCHVALFEGRLYVYQEITSLDLSQVTGCFLWFTSVSSL
jgi:hypothetical protein